MSEKTIYIARNPFHGQFHFGVEVDLGVVYGGKQIRYTRESWETEKEAREVADKRFGSPFGVTLRFVQGGAEGYLVPMQKAKQLC